MAQDSVQYAYEMGRLDFLSASLAVLSIALILAGIFSFLNIRSDAKKIAKKVAEKEAERVANIYMQKNIPAIID